MKRFVWTLLLACAAATAQEDPSVAAERARLTAERSRAESDFKAQEKACYGKFGVNDCLNAARSKRRQLLSDLRRQEIALNDSERKRKAAERRISLEERNLDQAKRQEAEKRDSGQQEKERQSRVSEKAAARASQAASAPAKAAARAEQERSKTAGKEAARQRQAEEAAKTARARELRASEAAERKQNLEQQKAARKKPPAKPLPVPP